MKNTSSLIVPVITFLLVLLFTYAAVNKLMDYTHFRDQLRSSELLRPVAGMLTWMIPTVELYTVALLLVTGWRKSGMLLSSVVLFLFTAYIAVMLLFFERIPCSCGGVLQYLSWREHLVFNLLFLVVAVAGTVLLRKQAHPPDAKN